MKDIVNQLLMDEVEIAYWHVINTNSEGLFGQAIETVFEQLLANALFVKTHCNEKEVSDIFRAFVVHNFPEIVPKYLKVNFGK